jgi:N-acetylglucosaminyldiphosphoundecaprenol N-acetyl-beta-D-mannosaminyltransferase
MKAAIEIIEKWIDEKHAHYICALDVHSLMRAQDDAAHNQALCHADMVLPDGMPLVWLSKLRGQKDIERVCGPDLMLCIFEHSTQKAWRHYFFGGSQGVAEALASRARNLYPNLIVAGTDCPPFRAVSARELEDAIARINAASPDIVWIGLGCPRQEIWMSENAAKLKQSIAIGVGAAFDFHTGRIKRAPPWMRSAGLEWLYRLLSEPRRLWYRYLYLAPRFIAICSLDLFRSALLRTRPWVRRQ